VDEVRFERVHTNGITLNVAQAGPADGPLLILLHGFPEFWYGWSKHIPALAAAGFRVWAPDQRGYNTSDKPVSVSDYRLDLLAADVVGLIETARAKQAIVVGHDWGGAVAWWLASNHPERLEKLVIINVPHPLVLRRLLLTSPRQLLRSWYMFLIQLPGLPEWASRSGNWDGLASGMRSSSLPGTFTDDDFAKYREAWSQPGAIGSMLNWYRAMFRYGAPRPRHALIPTPTLILWGAKDKFIGREGAERSLLLCNHVRLDMFEHNTHWLPHEEPAEITKRIVEFVRGTEYSD
jgi:pimeloyl-ACP methyl ester carboxylesterase